MQRKHKSSECKVDMRRRLSKADKMTASKGEWNRQGASKREVCKERERETGAYGTLSTERERER